jgi:DNA-binding LacI/PurR family transcriptional regulator
VARRRATVRDVAVTANVSAQTVSNYINGRFDEMGGETRVRIAAAMDELAYHPDSTARSFRSKRTRTLVFIVVDEGRRFLADPMTDLILAGISDVTRERDYGLLIQARDSDTHPTKLLAPLYERRADAAFLFLSGEREDRLLCADKLQADGIPCVVFEEDPPTQDVISVSAANRDGAAQLVGWLIERGHRRIAFIAGKTCWPMIEQRHLGYRDALTAAGLPADADLEVFQGMWDVDTGAPLAQSLVTIPDPPTAIVCANDLLALGAMHQLRDHGLSIPADVAVVGFNDFDFSAYLDPPLTTVRIPGYEIGRVAAERLIDALERPLETDSENVVLPVEIVLRGSA